MVLYLDLFMPKSKMVVESEGFELHSCSDIEVHGGTTDHMRPDKLSLSVGCASACEGVCTESCSALSDCDAVTTLSSFTYSDCLANERPLFNCVSDSRFTTLVGDRMTGMANVSAVESSGAVFE